VAHSLVHDIDHARARDEAKTGNAAVFCSVQNCLPSVKLTKA
jgi:hypothetical protein